MALCNPTTVWIDNMPPLNYPKNERCLRIKKWYEIKSAAYFSAGTDASRCFFSKEGVQTSVKCYLYQYQFNATSSLNAGLEWGNCYTPSRTEHTVLDPLTTETDVSREYDKSNNKKKMKKKEKQRHDNQSSKTNCRSEVTVQKDHGRLG